MALFDDASLVVTPNGYKAGTLYSIKPTSGAGDMTVVRATTATRVNSAGLIESVANNVPRLDYSNGTCPSLLVEPQRTNVKTNSENASGSNWGTAVRVNATINSIASPDGNVTANSIADTAVSGTHAFEPSFSATSGTAYTFSVFAKANTLSQVVIYGYADNGVFAGQQAIFNITNGTVISNTGGGTTNVVNYGNGYYRVSLTLTSGATSTGYWAFGLAKNGLASYLGDGSSLYMWGCQLEAGSYPNSYIPTTSAAVTRNADVISKTGISALIGQTEGTMFVDFIAKGFYNSDNLLMLISTGSGGEIIYLNLVSGTIEAYIAASSTQQFLYNGVTVLTANTSHKLAIGYANNDIVLYHNGTQLATDMTASIPACTLLRVGNFLGGTLQFNSGINSAILFPTRLTNAELISLTTI